MQFLFSNKILNINAFASVMVMQLFGVIHIISNNKVVVDVLLKIISACNA